MPSFPGELEVNSHETLELRGLAALGSLTAVVAALYLELSPPTVDSALTLLTAACMYIMCVPVSQTSSMAPEMTSVSFALDFLLLTPSLLDNRPFMPFMT